MNPTKDDITKASKQIGLTDSQTESLWQALQQIQTNKPKFNLSTVLFYFGAMIAMISMTWFYISHLNSSLSLLISIIYALIFFSLGIYFWHAKKWKIPGGLLSSLGIIMVPLIVYSLQNLLNWWPTHSMDNYNVFNLWDREEGLPMEICTFLVACLVLYFVRFPFITVLIYSSIWLIAMDTVDGFGNAESVVSITIGIILNILGYGLYRKNQPDFGFWSYLFGMLLCSLGLFDWDIQTEWGYFIYFLINFAFLLLSSFFHRKIFMFFGSLGIIYYISHLAYVFSNSLMFSYILGAIGFGIILFATFLLRSRKSRQLR